MNRGQFIKNLGLGLFGLTVGTKVQSSEVFIKNISNINNKSFDDTLQKMSNIKSNLAKLSSIYISDNFHNNNPKRKLNKLIINKHLRIIDSFISYQFLYTEKKMNQWKINDKRKYDFYKSLNGNANGVPILWNGSDADFLEFYYRRIQAAILLNDIKLAKKYYKSYTLARKYKNHNFEKYDSQNFADLLFYKGYFKEAKYYYNLSAQENIKRWVKKLNTTDIPNEEIIKEFLYRYRDNYDYWKNKQIVISNLIKLKS